MSSWSGSVRLERRWLISPVTASMICSAAEGRGALGGTLGTGTGWGRTFGLAGPEPAVRFESEETR